MIHADTLVGTVAIVLGVAIGMTALSPTATRLQLGIANHVRKHCGDFASRLVIAVIAASLLFAGVMILRGFRPRFADPRSSRSGPEVSVSDSLGR